MLKKLREEFEEHTGKSFKAGVNIENLPALEVYFKVSIDVYKLDESGNADVIRLSKLDYPTLRLNLHGNHFSYIKDFTKYAKKYTCLTCRRIFNQSGHLKRHAKECTIEVKEYYKGGKYRQKKTLFDDLEQISIDVPENLRFCPWFTVFDMESIQVQVDDELNGRKLVSRHEPATYSTCSNLPGHKDPVHMRSDGDTQKLIDNLVLENLKQQATFSKLMRGRYAPYIQLLKVRSQP